MVKEPFKQLWSIHAFARAETKLKQLPLFYVLMSGKRRVDYRRILKVVKNEFERNKLTCSVQVVVSDFEAAVWQAFRKGIKTIYFIIIYNNIHTKYT